MVRTPDSFQTSAAPINRYADALPHALIEKNPTIYHQLVLSGALISSSAHLQNLWSPSHRSIGAISLDKSGLCISTEATSDVNESV